MVVVLSIYKIFNCFFFFPDFQNQINDITSYIDASNVYGSSDEESAELRSFTGGNYIEDFT